MNFTEFMEYMDNHLQSRETFVANATEYQNVKNRRRAPAKRWKEEKIQRAVNNMWTDLLKTIYARIKPLVKASSSEPKKEWINYIETNEILDSLDESIYEIEFE